MFVILKYHLRGYILSSILHSASFPRMIKADNGIFSGLGYCLALIVHTLMYALVYPDKICATCILFVSVFMMHLFIMWDNAIVPIKHKKSMDVMFLAMNRNSRIGTKHKDVFYLCRRSLLTP